MLFSALLHRKPYFVPVCCCCTWFSGLFAANWLIFAWSHLKQCFYCFVSKFRFFQIFLHWIKNLAFLKLVTLILAIPQSKERFLLFWVQITLLQDFFHGIKVLACFQLITLILAIFHAKKCFCRCGAKLRCVQLFRTGNGFRLFEAFHIDSNYIWLKRKLLLFRRCISALLHLEPFLCWFPGFTHFLSSLNQNRCSGTFADNWLILARSHSKQKTVLAVSVQNYAVLNFVFFRTAWRLSPVSSSLRCFKLYLTHNNLFFLLLCC